MAEQIEEHVLLAYALGELDSKDLQQVDDAVVADEELAELVDEFRDVSIGVISALREEPMPSLTDEQRKAIWSEATHPSKPSPLRSPWAFAGFVAAAALVFLAIAIPVVRTYYRWQAESHKIAGGISDDENRPKIDDVKHVPPIVVKAGARSLVLAASRPVCGYGIGPLIGAERGGDTPPSELLVDALVMQLPLDVGRAPIADLEKLVYSSGRVPSAKEVGVAELVNCFVYAHPFEPAGPIAAYTEEGACWWSSSKRIIMIALHPRGDKTSTTAELQLVADKIGSCRLLGIDDKPAPSGADSLAKKPFPLSGELTLMCEVTPKAPLKSGEIIGAVVVGRGESRATVAIKATGREIDAASRTYRLATSAAAYGMLLEEPGLRERLSFDEVQALYQEVYDPGKEDQVAMHMLMVQTGNIVVISSK